MRKKGRKLLKVRIEIEEEEEKNDDGVREDVNISKSEKKVKQIEGALFVPATPGSGLKKLLQEAEDKAEIMMNTPSIRIVERAGTKIMEEIGDSNPWKSEWSCQRMSCLPKQTYEGLSFKK